MQNNSIIDVSSVKKLLDEYNKAQNERKRTEKKAVKFTEKNYLESNVTSRAFCCETYIEREHLDKFIMHAPFIKHWAICTHDSDIVCDKDGNSICDESTGEPLKKGVHTHFLLYTYHNKTASAIRKIFDRYSKSIYIPLGLEPQNTLTQCCSDMVVQWRYLIHQDEYGKNGKVLYPPECRICDDISYWSCLEQSYGLIDFNKNRAINMYIDFKSGCSHEDMLLKYGMVYMQNINKMYTMAEYPTIESYLERKKNK